MFVIDLSKVLMYELCYYYTKNRCGNNSRILFTDANSLMYGIKTDYVYEDSSKDKKMFDFSNYSAKSKYNDDY